jgi:hypothetical protein
MANQPHYGKIIAERDDQWGRWVEITVTHNCIDEAVEEEYTYMVSRHMVHTVSQGNGHTRIVTVQAEEEYHQRQMDEHMARMARS